MDRHNEEIRKAFERLQRTVGMIADRMHGLQRERKLMLERIDELEQACQSMDATVSERSDEAMQRQQRVAELEEQVLRAEHELEVSKDKIRTLQDAISEREALIADQEDALVNSRRTIEQLQHRQTESVELLGQIEQLKREVESAGESAESRAAEWERRIAEAERSRDAAKEAAETLLSERDQARATVESMLVRVRQLEANDDEQTAALREKTDSLGRDLEEALEMASAKESESETLRERLNELEERVAESNGSFMMSDNDKALLIDQVESALTLIDKHLGEHAEEERG